MTVLIVIFLTSLFFSGLFSMLEAAVISQDKHRLQHLAEEGDKRAAVMQRLLAQTDRLLSTLLLCNNLANVACASTATAIAAYLLPGGDASLIYVTLIVTFILLVFSEITPKVIGVRYASALAVAFAVPLSFLIRALQPATAVARFFSDCLLWLVGMKSRTSWHSALSVKELRSAVRAAGRTEEANREHYHIVEKTLRFNELSVEKIMTPRSSIKGINLQDDAQKIISDIEDSSFSKLPLFDGNVDEPRGTIEVVTALKRIRGGGFSPSMLRQIATDVHYLPAAAGALTQLENMRKHRLAFVADGSGRVVGIVTFANFAAAIIGEETPPTAKARADGALELAGDTSLLKLEQLQPGSVAPADTGATTINGMILEHLGYPPTNRLCINIGDWLFEVLEADDKSVRRVLLLPPPPPPAKTDNEE